MMRTLLLAIFSFAMLAGSFEACKHPSEPLNRCDTCDTTHVANPNDTSSHAFIWTEYHLPTNQVTEDDATGCWVFSPTNILVNNWYLYRFDGASFKKLFLWNSEGGELSSISGCRIFAFDSTDFWLGYGGVVWHVDGRRYQDELVAWITRLDQTGVWHYPEDGGNNAMWGTSSKDMFFVGDKGTILHFDGTTWIKYPKVTDVKLFSVWGTSHNDVWACGLDQTLGTTVLIHFDGNVWSVDSMSFLPGAVTGSFTGVFAADSAGHRTAIAVGSRAYRTTDNGSWRVDSLSHLNDTYIGTSVTGNTPNDLMLYGGWGLILHWNGKTWYRYDELFAPSALGYVPHAAHMRDNTVCIVGKKNGTSWIAIGQR